MKVPKTLSRDNLMQKIKNYFFKKKLSKNLFHQKNLSKDLFHK